MKRWLILSLLLNAVLLVGILAGIRRGGGWRYLFKRLQYGESGLYANRQDQLARLPEQPGAIVFVGDSQIEQGEWHEWLGDQPPVLNRGITGDGAEGVLARLDTDVLRQKPSKIVLCVGVNDLFFGKKPDEVAALYRRLVQGLRQGAPQADLLLVSVLPVNNQVRNTGLDNAQVRELNAAIRQIAGEWAVSYLDLYGPLADADGRLAAKFTADGVHLNGLGYGVWKHNLASYFNK
ncbi:MAG: hypothetical protein IT259_19505 [Saprospiraceae bacterium]|nr:hypothetical protein [Saprospiraceae bacterium]